MNKNEWRRHIATILADAVDRGELSEYRTSEEACEYTKQHVQTCAVCADRAKTARRNSARRERDQAMRDIGMRKVRGNLGGTYWE